MPGFETPRRMSTIGGREIRRRLPELAAFYDDDQLLGELSALVGRRLYRATHADECIVMNFLNGSGQTHGWHVDDPDFALVIVVETPPPERGGTVELIRSFDRDALFRGSLETFDEKEELYLQSGDLYFLHASQILHRVTPLRDAHGERIAINFAFDTKPIQVYGDTASILYGEAATC